METAAICEPSGDQAISATSTSAGHHQPGSAPFTPTTYKLVSSGAAIVRTAASGSGLRGSASTAKRVPSGDIVAERIPEGRERICTSFPSASGTIANWGNLPTGYIPYSEPSFVKPEGSKCSGRSSFRAFSPEISIRCHSCLSAGAAGSAEETRERKGLAAGGGGRG